MMSTAGDDTDRATKTLLCSSHPGSAATTSKENGKKEINDFRLKKTQKFLTLSTNFFFSLVFFPPDFIKGGNPVTGTGEMKVCSLKAVCLTVKITELVTKAAHIVGFF